MITAMKKILLSLAALASIASMTAQTPDESTNRPDNQATEQAKAAKADDDNRIYADYNSDAAAQPLKRFTFGVRAGLNLSSFSSEMGEELDHTRFGFNIGGAVELNIIKAFSINSGLYFTTKGGKSNRLYGDHRVKYSANPMYFEIPLLASLRLNMTPTLQWQFNFGPYFDLGIGGNYKMKAPDESVKLRFFGKEYGGRRFNMGLSLGTGVTIHEQYYVGIYYQYGLTNAMRYYNGKDGIACISVGYNFKY
jgi:hypothetical protein